MSVSAGHADLQGTLFSYHLVSLLFSEAPLFIVNADAYLLKKPFFIFPPLITVAKLVSLHSNY